MATRPTRRFDIAVTHWDASTGAVKRRYVVTVHASDRTAAIYQVWDRDPYAHRFEDVTQEETR